MLKIFTIKNVNLNANRYPKETKTALYHCKDTYVGKFENGYLKQIIPVMPAIKDVREFDGGIVKVYFNDDTFEISKLQIGDTYSLEQGITICIAKKLISDKVGNGSAVYNKIIRNALKVKARKDKERKELANMKNKNVKRIKQEKFQKSHEKELLNDTIELFWRRFSICR